MSTIHKKYKFAVIASDIVVLTIHRGRLKALLIKMKKAPFHGRWAAPGGLVQAREGVEEAARRILQSKAGSADIYLEQLYTFGRVDRDPFGRVVSVAYLGLVPNAGIAIHTNSDYADIQWFDVKRLPKLAYDHKEVLETAIKRLRSKIAYTSLIQTLLPAEFMLKELQDLYEVILGRRLDRRNFRKKFLSLKLLKKLNKKRPTGASRPAILYSFINKQPILANIL